MRLKVPHLRRSFQRLALVAALLSPVAFPQAKLPQQAVIDLKTLGIASDLFTDQSDSKTQQRGLISVFWIDDERIAAGFSINRRWSPTEKPEPLKVHLVVFRPDGKQLNDRYWSFSDEGPDAATTLNLAPGPDDSILAVFDSHSQTRIPDGDYVQVLNADTTLRQNFYIPATSALAPSITPQPALVLQSFFADRRSSLTWWAGNPLKPSENVSLPPGEAETLAGPPGIASRANCSSPTLCFSVRVYRPEGTIWSYSPSAPEVAPVPRVFLNATALVIELRDQEEKKDEMIVSHPAAPPTSLLTLPHGLQIVGVTGVSQDGRRLALNAAGEAGICGAFGLWCNQRTRSVVVDVPSSKIIFEQEVSSAGGTSSLSPDGRRVAVFDKSKLSIYSLP